jgi:hypothetical protein
VGFVGLVLSLGTGAFFRDRAWIKRRLMDTEIELHDLRRRVL